MVNDLELKQNLMNLYLISFMSFQLWPHQPSNFLETFRKY